VSELPKDLIVDYRKGVRIQKPKECIFQFQHVKSANEAAPLMGRKVSMVPWRTHGSRKNRGTARQEWPRHSPFQEGSARPRPGNPR